MKMTLDDLMAMDPSEVVDIDQSGIVAILKHLKRLTQESRSLKERIETLEGLPCTPLVVAQDLVKRVEALEKHADNHEHPELNEAAEPLLMTFRSPNDAPSKPTDCTPRKLPRPSPALSC